MKFNPKVAFNSKLLFNSLFTAAAALFFSQVLHESIHLFSAWAVGAHANAFNLFAVDTVLFKNGADTGKNIIIEGSASIVNVIIGFLSLLVFSAIKRMPSLFRQFFLQLTGYSMLMGFGYFMFDALFYSPGAVGDWKSILTMLGGSLYLRIPLILIGGGGVLFTFFWMAKNILVFCENRESKQERFKTAFPVLLMPYIVYGILYLVLSLWHPIGFPDGLLVIFFQFVFGFSGFLWAFFLSVYWLKPNLRDQRYFCLPVKLSFGWMAFAIAILVFEIAYLLPTVQIN
jgi:hypothetical protein